jgi:hypothetical protein
MTEAHPGPDLQQIAGLRSVRCGRRDPELLCGTPKQERLSNRLGGRDQQQQARVVGQRPQPAHETLFHTVGEAASVRVPEASGQLHRRQLARQLEHRQRVALRLGDDPVPDPLVHRAAQRRHEQRARVAVGEALYGQLGDGGELRGRLTGGEDQRDGFRDEPPSHEGEDLA